MQYLYIQSPHHSIITPQNGYTPGNQNSLHDKHVIAKNIDGELIFPEQCFFNDESPPLWGHDT
jgi:hypothetical protein